MAALHTASLGTCIDRVRWDRDDEGDEDGGGEVTHAPARPHPRPFGERAKYSRRESDEPKRRRDDEGGEADCLCCVRRCAKTREGARKCAKMCGTVMTRVTKSMGVRS